MFTNILGYPIFGGTKAELIDIINNYEKVHIVSGNPEVLFNGINNKELYTNFTGENSIIIPDGVGTLIASKLVHKPVKEKIAGIEVMDEILKYCMESNKGVYLLGAKQEILKECMDKLKERYPGINIAGSHNGYFDMNNCSDILMDIKASGAFVLFAAMGAPRQEKFIVKYMDELSCKVFMGVGGSFDVFAGRVSRAPGWMIKFGLEWLYRIGKEPWRIKRLGSIPKFLLMVIVKGKAE